MDTWFDSTFHFGIFYSLQLCHRNFNFEIMDPAGMLKQPPDSTNSDLHTVHLERNDDSVSLAQSTSSVSTSAHKSQLRDPYLPEDDGSILTPEHAFVQYQARSEDQACQICCQPAVGFHHRAYVCEACKVGQ